MFNNNGDIFATCSNQEILFWDAKSYSLIIDKKFSTKCENFCFTPDDKYIFLINYSENNSTVTVANL